MVQTSFATLDLRNEKPRGLKRIGISEEKNFSSRSKKSSRKNIDSQVNILQSLAFQETRNQFFKGTQAIYLDLKFAPHVREICRIVSKRLSVTRGFNKLHLIPIFTSVICFFEPKQGCFTQGNVIPGQNISPIFLFGWTFL